MSIFGPHERTPSLMSDDSLPTSVQIGWRTGLLIFAVAIALRGAVLFELSRTPFFTSLIGDSWGYHTWAERLAAGDWVGEGVFYQAPLYPYVLGLLYRVFGADALVAKLFQILLEGFSCVLLASASTRFFASRRVGILAGGFAALYAPIIFFTTLVQKASLGFFLTALVLELLSRIARSVRSPGLLPVLGLSLGLLALTRENALIFVVLVAFWLALKHRDVSKPTLAAWIALLLLGASVPLGLVGLRNAVVGGEFALTTSQFGTNFYIGNNANAKGFYLPLRLNRGNVVFEADDARRMAEETLGRALSPGEVSKFWTDRTIEYIAENPIDWLGLMVRKSLLVWNRVEASDSEDIAAYRHFSRVLDALARVFHFGIMVPLAAAGLWLTRSRWRELWILYSMAAVYAASLTLFFLFARYRVPLIPFTLMFAAAGVSELRGLVGRRERRGLAAAGGVIVCVAVLVNLPLTDTQDQLAATYKNFGNAMIAQEKFPEAVEYFGKSLEYRPDVMETLRGMAESLADLGRLPEARTYFERMLEVDPENFSALLGSGRLDLSQGRTEAGIQKLVRATRRDPSDARPFHFLGAHYAQQRDLAAAIVWLRGAAERESSPPVARMMLARVLHRSGDEAAAKLELKWILDRDPKDVPATMLLATIAFEEGQLGRARSLYQRVLELRPKHVNARKNLARVEKQIEARNP